MLSIPLLKRTICRYWKDWLLFTGILNFCLLFGIGTYGTKMASVMQFTPDAMKYLLSVDAAGTGLTEYLSAYQYGIWFFLCPFIYELLMTRSMIVQELEEKSMTHLIAAPMSRDCIIGTKAYFLIMSLAAMFFSTILIGLLFCMLLWPGKLVVSQFILLNLGCFCLHVCISGIVFLTSCICDDSRMALGIGAGITVIFYILHVLANAGGVLGLFRFLTIFSLYDRQGVMGGSLFSCIAFLLLAVLGVVLYVTGNKLFEKRDLPL